MEEYSHGTDGARAVGGGGGLPEERSDRQGPGDATQQQHRAHGAASEDAFESETSSGASLCLEPPFLFGS